MIRLFAATIALSAFGATPALAQTASDKPFQGPSVTAIGGVDDSQWYDGAKAGALYGGQVGYDWQSAGIVFGVEGEVTGATGTHCVTIYHVGGGTDRSCVSPRRDFYAGGRIGTVVGESTLLYAKAGYSNAGLGFDYRPGGTGPASHLGNATADGFRVGAGIEQRLGGNLTLKAEYRYSNYEGGYSRHQGVMGLGFRF